MHLQKFINDKAKIIILHSLAKWPNDAFFAALLTSEAYLEMFRDLVRIHFDPGPFNWSWSNVPIQVLHIIQVATDLLEGEEKYAREYLPELGRWTSYLSYFAKDLLIHQVSLPFLRIEFIHFFTALLISSVSLGSNSSVHRAPFQRQL